MVEYLEQIKEIEEEIKKTQYNKATQHHVGLLKAKIAILRQKQEARSKKSPGEGFAVKKSGDATACLLGFPSVGKSTILNRLTNAESRTAAYAFTTLTCIPGVLNYKSAKIQILDVPGIIKGAAGGAGKGREVLAVVRNSDLVILVADIFDLKQIEAIRKELYDANIRLDEGIPEVTIKTTLRGGIHLATLKKLTKISTETVLAILKEYKINNAYVTIREDITAERFIDALEGNRTFLPSLLILNKSDLASKEQIESSVKTTGGMPVSAASNKYMEELKEVIFQRLKFIRIYLKEYGKKADMDEPLIMKSGTRVREVCQKLHKDFVAKFKYARVWGKSAKYPGEKYTNLDHLMMDQDVLEIKLR